MGVEATYELATIDGARIKAGTNFEDFPFNLSSGKTTKKLWLIRKEPVPGSLLDFPANSDDELFLESRRLSN